MDLDEVRGADGDSMFSWAAGGVEQKCFVKIIFGNKLVFKGKFKIIAVCLGAERDGSYLVNYKSWVKFGNFVRNVKFGHRERNCGLG